MLVKPLGAIMKRMYKQSPDTCIFRHRHSPIDRILKQGSAQLDTLGTMVNGKPRQYHHRYGVRHVTPDTARSHLVRDCAGRHCVVAEYAAFPIGNDKCATCSAQLIRQRTALEPLIQTGFPAGKRIQKMRGRERLRLA